jgi:hypothetical protein
MRPVAIGVAVGLMRQRALPVFLPVCCSVKPLDTLHCGSSRIAVLIAVLACYLPARHAA